MTLTPDELAAIRAREAAATAGPWMVPHMCEDEHPCNCRSILSPAYCGAIAEIPQLLDKPIPEGGNDCPPETGARCNADFIAHSRQDIPDLLADHDALTARVRELELALQPFAVRAEFFEGRLKANGGDWQNDDGYSDDPPSDIYIGQLRAARKALGKGEG